MTKHKQYTRADLEPFLHLTFSEAAAAVGIQQKTLANYEKAYDIRFPRKSQVKKRPPLEAFADVCARMTTAQAAEYFGVQHSTIKTWGEVYDVRPLRCDRRNPDMVGIQQTADPVILASVRLRMSGQSGGWNRWAECG